MSMEHLITDRTSADVERWRTLHDKGWSAMNEAERAEWLAEMKGRYTYTDLNRVESAVAVVSERIRELGYEHPRLTVKTNWTRSDCPTKDDMDRYFGNVAALRGAVAVLPGTPATPTTKGKLDYQMANDLEKILVNVDEVATKIQRAWCYAGDIYFGEV